MRIKDTYILLSSAALVVVALVWTVALSGTPLTVFALPAYYLSSNTTAAGTAAGTLLTALSPTGFTVGSSALTNTNGDNYVGWAWKSSATSGFTTVSYTGTGAAHTIAHTLGATPAFIMIKRTDTGGSNWVVWHQNITTPATDYMRLNEYSQVYTDATVWNSTAPTSANFTVGTNVDVNASGGTYLAYVFTEKSGFSKFGTYTANVSADGPFIYTGFKPRWLMVKKLGSAYGWRIEDTARNTYNPVADEIEAQISGAENTQGANSYIDFNANGFKIRNNGNELNNTTNGSNYIYAAFADIPFKEASSPYNLSIASSTRFNGTNASLSRTPSVAGNRKTWTWSGWVKRSDIAGNFQALFDGGPWNGGVGAAFIRFANGTLSVDEYNGTITTWAVATQNLFRDPATWMHITVSVDTTQATASNRVKIYVNGSQVTALSTTNYPTVTYDTGVGLTVPHSIGQLSLYGQYFNGYMADIYFIDGQALTAASFGEFDTNGFWKPKTYSGTYGTNGFHLKFADATNPGKDSDGGTSTTKTVFLTSGSSWTVPADWDSASNAANTIEVIGAGGGTTGQGGGGGGGAYSKITNLTLTSGASITYAVGTSASGTSGGDSYFNGASCGASSVCAKGGGGSTTGTGGTGGQAASGVGTVKFSGGNGGTSPAVAFSGGGGGGGSAGPNGTGANGGNGSASGGSGGGGGANGGAAAANATSGSGTSGGNGRGGSGGGAPNCSSGTNGGGGSGGSLGPFPGGYCVQGSGGMETIWTQTSDSATAGPSGGGGGGQGITNIASGGSPGGASYGGGGGGGGWGISSPGGNSPGGQGIIVITYLATTRNNFTNNNIATTDNVADSPTNNFATINSIIPNGYTLSQGNLGLQLNNVVNTMAATIGISSGKWYWEQTLNTAGSNANHYAGIVPLGFSPTTYVDAQNGVVYSNGSGSKAINGAYSAYGASWTSGDTIGVAYDADSGSVTFYKNGVSQGVAATGLSGTYFPAIAGTTNGTAPFETYNFGQGGQAGLTYDAASGGYFKYTPPAGFKALSTANMPASAVTKPNDYFNAVTYTGNGTTQAITSLNFQPDLLWIKDRSSAQNHVLFGDGSSGTASASMLGWFSEF